MPWYGGFDFEADRDPGKLRWSGAFKKRPASVWMERGTQSCHDKIYYDSSEKVYYAYGAWYKNSGKTKYNRGEGEYPTLEWLRSKGLVKKGDIVVQWDNPNVRSPYTGKWQTRSNNSGTKSHVMIYTGSKSKNQTAQVGAGSTQHKTVRNRYGKKRVFSAYGITHSNKDGRNRHKNPHVAFIVRVK